MSLSSIINPWSQLAALRKELATFRHLADSYKADLETASLQVRGLQIQLDAAQASLANALANARKKPGRKPAVAAPEQAPEQAPE